MFSYLLRIFISSLCSVSRSSGQWLQGYLPSDINAYEHNIMTSRTSLRKFVASSLPVSRKSSVIVLLLKVKVVVPTFFLLLSGLKVLLATSADWTKAVISHISTLQIRKRQRGYGTHHFPNQLRIYLLLFPKFLR